MSLPISMKPADTTPHLILSRYRAAKRFPRASLEIPCLIDISNGTRTHFDITESKCNTPLPSRSPRPCRSVSPFPRFNEQLAHARNGRNTSDELKLASGVSKSSIRYVSTSPEGWIGSASKSREGEGEGPVEGFGQGRPVERE